MKAKKKFQVTGTHQLPTILQLEESLSRVVIRQPTKKTNIGYLYRTTLLEGRQTLSSTLFSAIL